MFHLTMVPTLLPSAACRRLGAHHPLLEQAVLQRMAPHQMTQQAKEGEAQTVPAPALKQVRNWEHDQQSAEHQMCLAQLQQHPVGCGQQQKSMNIEQQMVSAIGKGPMLWCYSVKGRAQGFCF